MEGFESTCSEYSRPELLVEDARRLWKAHRWQQHQIHLLTTPPPPHNEHKAAPQAKPAVGPRG